MQKRIVNNLKIPEEIIQYLKIKNDCNCDYGALESNIEVNYDSFGRIISIAHYTPDRELLRIIFYEGSKVAKINNYRAENLYSTEEYTNNLMLAKTIYKRNGDVQCVYKYEYNKENKISRISKYREGRDVLVCYRYDFLGRIIERNVCLNGKHNIKQKFNYDILDRVVDYEDNNQKLHVNAISQKNELISYVITDTMGNNINVENHFADCGYICTSIVLNGHSTKVNDSSYVDNIMLKKPSASEDDLDLIISNLFSSVEEKNYTKDLSTSVKAKSKSLIDKNIENRTLPISIRKRVLYNALVNEKLVNDKK